MKERVLPLPVSDTHSRSFLLFSCNKALACMGVGSV